MIFNSFPFVLLVLVTFVIYYMPLFRRWQVFILIAASFTFYAANSPVLLLLLLSSILINIAASYFIVHGASSKKLTAVIGVILNLAILAFFKYSPLIGRTIFKEDSSIGEFLIMVPLPIGISFFMFQGISLLVDTYRENQQTEYKSLVPKLMTKHSMQTALFISFFPQLVAGPIVKSKDFIPQIRAKSLNGIAWETCFKNIVTGYFLKMVIADNLKDFTLITYPFFETRSTINLLTMLFGYSMQIFADFAGYSLIAIGIAGLFGYQLRDNFMFPYISTSFSEFWNRWHISLSSFLKEYLYIPLGGNRKGKFRTYLNLFITMVLGGLWHGAAWSYAVWGIYHGLALAIERLVRQYLPIGKGLLSQIMNGLFVFSIVTLGWLLFKLPEFSEVIYFIKALANNFSIPLYIRDYRDILMIAIYSAPVIAYHFYYLFKHRKKDLRLQNWEFLAYGVMIFLLITNSGSAKEFIYFQF